MSPLSCQVWAFTARVSSSSSKTKFGTIAELVFDWIKSCLRIVEQIEMSSLHMDCARRSQALYDAGLDYETFIDSNQRQQQVSIFTIVSHLEWILPKLKRPILAQIWIRCLNEAQIPLYEMLQSEVNSDNFNHILQALQETQKITKELDLVLATNYQHSVLLAVSGLVPSLSLFLKECSNKCGASCRFFRTFCHKCGAIFTSYSNPNTKALSSKLVARQLSSVNKKCEAMGMKGSVIIRSTG
jgi:hypothetical protein